MVDLPVEAFDGGIGPDLSLRLDGEGGGRPVDRFVRRQGGRRPRAGLFGVVQEVVELGLGGCCVGLVVDVSGA